MYNIIIVGARDQEYNVNNSSQASHIDLCNLKNIFENVTIKCYDPLYNNSFDLDGIEYIKDLFYINDTNYFKKEAINIIVEFCNLFDENDINNSKYYNSEIFNYNIVYLACGCSYDKGFPIECISLIMNTSGIYTPFDNKNIDSYLYSVSIVNNIYNENKEDIMEPYLNGLYHILGTLKWRGYRGDNYKSEHVLRELFTLIDINTIENINDTNKKDLYDFVKNKKHWNKMNWNTRENITKFIYGKKIQL